MSQHYLHICLTFLVFTCNISVTCLKNVLVLGGTGFVGGNFIKLCNSEGINVVSISRRGQPSSDTIGSSNRPGSDVKWIKGDATDINVIKNVIDTSGPFDGCIHCIGLLFDNDSKLSSINKYASGSGSVPSADSSYDKITRITAFNVIDTIQSSPSSSLLPDSKGRFPFVFVSAAEAGWTFKAPVSFLERYLIAKRAVESKINHANRVKNDDNNDGSRSKVRGIIMRPSIIWTIEKPLALLSVIPFYIGNRIGLPFVDRPVTVQALCTAALNSMKDSNIEGIQRYQEMEDLNK